MSQSVTNINAGKTIPQMLKELPPERRRIVEKFLHYGCEKLIKKLPIIGEAIALDSGQASVTQTMSFTPGKRGREFGATIKFRSRVPDETEEFTAHLDDDDQLSFGDPIGGWGDDESTTAGGEGGTEPED